MKKTENSPPLYQLGWYNTLVLNLGQSPQSFQLFQPSPVLVPGPDEDEDLWAFYNNLPEQALSWNYRVSPGNQFYSNYRSLVSALEPVDQSEAMIKTIGKQNWDAFVAKQGNKVKWNGQLISLFSRWAAKHNPAILDKGIETIKTLLLDPVMMGQTKLLDYINAGHTFPQWNKNYAHLQQQLENSKPISFKFNSRRMDLAMENHWAGFQQTEHEQGLDELENYELFIKASFDRITTFMPFPESWYYNRTFQFAFENEGNPPWNDDSSIDWDLFFGDKGNMRFLLKNLIIASGVDVYITMIPKENAVLSGQEVDAVSDFFIEKSPVVQQTIEKKPTATTVRISSDKGVPVIIGGNVVSTSDYIKLFPKIV